MALLEVKDISVRFGGIVALTDLSFDIQKGEICGLIGPNGAGKTTLFNVVSRIYDPSGGALTFDGEDLLEMPPHKISQAGVFRTFQNLALWPRMTVLDNDESAFTREFNKMVDEIVKLSLTERPALS